MSNLQIPLKVSRITDNDSFHRRNTNLDEYFGQLDTQLLSEDTADNYTIPLILYFVSFAIVYATGFVVETLVTISLSIYEKYPFR